MYKRQEFKDTLTIQLVLLSYYFLCQGFDEQPNDSLIVSTFKQEFSKSLAEKFYKNCISATHLLATYLDPTLREFICITKKNDRKAALKQAIECIHLFAEDDDLNLRSESEEELNLSSKPLCDLSSAFRVKVPRLDISPISSSISEKLTYYKTKMHLKNEGLLQCWKSMSNF